MELKELGQHLRKEALADHMQMLSMLTTGEIVRLTRDAEFFRDVRVGKRLVRRHSRERQRTGHR